MAAYTVCRDPKCATLVEGKVSACPKCGGQMRTVGESPWRGIVLLICGLTLVIGMGIVTLNTHQMLTNPGVRMPDGGSWTGGAESARMALLTFYAVIAFGLVATANGVYMLVTKQQSRMFMIVSLGAAAILVGIVFMTMGTLKQDQPEERRTYRTY